MRRIVPLTLVLALATGVARADFNDGVVALMMGNYDQALQTFVPLAETSDHAFAQYFLGRMYAAGQGVEKNAETAAEWYRKAAEKGVADAQVRLGEMYENGEGVPADMEYAFGWYSVAAHLGNPKGNEGRERATAGLSAAERVEA
ncbi:MAG: tetratricopeptide repeat protein, partial [Gammaproteobacteria bacterium]